MKPDASPAAPLRPHLRLHGSMPSESVDPNEVGLLYPAEHFLAAGLEDPADPIWDADAFNTP